MNKQLSGPLIEELLKKALAAYRDAFFFCSAPAIKPVKVIMLGDVVRLEVVGECITLSGKLSGLTLICEEYWRAAHDIVAVHNVTGKLLDRRASSLFDQIRKEYVGAVHALLDNSFHHEATLCVARLFDYIAMEQVAVELRLTERFEQQDLTELACVARRRRTLERMFDGRKAARRRVLLASLVRNTPPDDVIGRRDMLEAAVPLLADWETGALRVKELLLDKCTGAISDPEVYVREVARVTFDAIAAKLVDDRAYHEALPVVELAIEHNINLPLQCARRWECRYALGHAENAEADWDTFKKYLDQILRMNAIATESDQAVVWNESDTAGCDNWRAYRRGRLKNIVLWNMRLMAGRDPVGGVSSSAKSPGRARKVRAQDAAMHSESARHAANDAQTFPDNLVRDSAKNHRLHNKSGVNKIRLPCAPFLANEEVAIDRYISEIAQARQA